MIVTPKNPLHNIPTPAQLSGVNVIFKVASIKINFTQGEVPYQHHCHPGYSENIS